MELVFLRDEWNAGKYRVRFCGFGVTEYPAKLTAFLRSFSRPKPREVYGYVVTSPDADVAASYPPVGYSGDEGLSAREARVLFSSTRELYLAVHATYFLDVPRVPDWHYRIIEYPYLLPILFEGGPERARNAALILGLDLRRGEDVDNPL